MSDQRYDDLLGQVPAGTYTYEIYFVFDYYPTPVLRSTQQLVVGTAPIPVLSDRLRLALILMLAGVAVMALRRAL